MAGHLEADSLILQMCPYGGANDGGDLEQHCDAGLAWWSEGRREKPVNSSTSIILVATDKSPQSAVAGKTAADLAARFGPELYVIHVGEVPVIHFPGFVDTPPYTRRANRWPRNFWTGDATPDV